MREIQRTVKEADLELMILDLSSLASVREFAAKLHATVDKVPHTRHLFLIHKLLTLTLTAVDRSAHTFFKGL